MTLELATALSALIVSILGTIMNYYKIKDAKKTWEHEQKISIEKQLLFERLKKRFELYPKTFELLGEVRDIEYPQNHYISLEKNKEQLLKIADNLLKELYGAAGLFMNYETRSALLKTYQVSYRYANDEVPLNFLVDSYYLSRRLLRKDLEFDDFSDSKSAKDILKDSKTESLELSKKKQESVWAKQGVLSRSCRPGYPNKSVSQKVVNETVQNWKNLNIKSIICLLSHEELTTYYKNIKGGLLNFYQTQNFQVLHIPIVDFQTPPVSSEELENILEEYNKMNKPMLIHCGAGEDRTGYVIDFICSQENC